MTALNEKKLNELIDTVLETYKKKGMDHIEGLHLPNVQMIYTIIDHLFNIIFPGYGCEQEVTKANLAHYVGEHMNLVYRRLVPEVEKSLNFQHKISGAPGSDKAQQEAEKIVFQFLKSLGKLRETLKDDVSAANDGDPAAKSFDEIILSYPCVLAITVYRLAHELYKAGVPLIPRMMTERAHSLTGIDIHPGARIGDHFFIDHGTGVVVGETCVIGSRVKIYQGVTLGALSFPKDDKGRVIKGQKRHPTIEDDVTIYAGATILGPVTIGRNSVIGGNVWLTTSINPGTVVSISEPELVIRSKPSGEARS